VLLESLHDPTDAVIDAADFRGEPAHRPEVVQELPVLV
jgi:hypothetical protein